MTFIFSLIFGNLYIYLAWQGKEYIDSGMRTTIFTAFGILAAVGCCIFLILKNQQKSDETNTENEEKSTALGNFREIGISIVNSFKTCSKIIIIHL